MNVAGRVDRLSAVNCVHVQMTAGFPFPSSSLCRSFLVVMAVIRSLSGARSAKNARLYEEKMCFGAANQLY